MATAVAVTAVAGCSGAEEHGGRPLHAPANLDLTLPAWVACSALIVEGAVVRVSDAESPGRMVTAVRVSSWVKPASGPRIARVETVDIAAHGIYRRWQPGKHLFLRVDVDPSALPSWDFSGGTIKRVIRALPASRSLDCPYGPA
jgi:hypothetical protein